MSRSFNLQGRFLHVIPLVLLPYLASCAARDPASSGATGRESVGEIQAALTVDLTPTGSANVSDLRNIQGEWTIDNVHDNNLSTKMYFGVGKKDDWIQYKLSVPAVVTRYDIAASADAAEYPKRVPSAWKFEASNDGIGWILLDAKSGQTPAAPTQYPISNTNPYLYYRLTISDNHGTDDTELAEFRIYGSSSTGTVPGTATNVAASVNSNSITISWTAAINATKYYVQRVGDDGTSVIENSVSGVTTFTDTGLSPGTAYIYQVQAANGTLRGPVSARVSATTAFAPRGLKDLTALSAALPSDEFATNTGEWSVDRITDNNPYTKWYQEHGTTWVRQQVPVGSVVSAYTLTSGNDFPERDPRSWKLEGSTDGTNWTEIDSRTNQAFAARHQTRTFTCNAAGLPYTYYRLKISARQSASDVQIGEWRLLGTSSTALGVPSAPSNLALNTYSYQQNPRIGGSPTISGNVVSSNQIGLKFTDNAGKQNPEAYFVLERATNSSFSANFASRVVGPNSTQARSIGLSPNTTYYFRVKAVNAANPAGSAYTNVLSATTLPASAPPNPWHENGWYEHYSRNLILAETDETNKVRIYLDELVPTPYNIHWLMEIMGPVWSRVNQYYGSLSDPYLNVIGNFDNQDPDYGPAGAVNLFDPRGGFRNMPFAIHDNWASLTWGDEANWWDRYKVEALTHETAHLVEAVSVNNLYGTAPNVWEDSAWAWVFQYDLFTNLPTQFPGRAAAWRAEGQTSHGDYGWYWARDWYIPIYEGTFGNSTASTRKGIDFLVKYFQLLSQALPTLNDDYAPRSFTMGDYVHFCSGAAGVDLSAQARIAFKWTPVQDLQFARAQADFPQITSLYKANQAPGFTFDPIDRTAQVGVALTGSLPAADPNPSDTLTFSKVSGPSWLTVSSNGTLGGTPTASGNVSATVKVVDAGGLSDTATLNINVSGGSGSTPCAGLCTSPITFTSANYNSGSLGSGATCHETSVTLAGINCSGFVSPRTLSVNGSLVTCNSQNQTPPAKRNGGYCLQASTGQQAWATFATF